ncbi:MAG: M48 family metalloprotease, partial [bacterium]|nr:M48 family metalloprotease [bacterium]
MALRTGEIPEARPLKPDEEQYGHQVLQALTEQYELDYNHPRYNEVVGIVEKLTAAAGADKDPWHVFILRDNNLKNAAATRGNHVFVWTGMLDYTSSEAELATVLSHEIAHVLARHTDPDPNEEARKLLVQVGAMAAAMAAAGATSSYQASQIVGNLTGTVTQEVASGMLIYPYTRDMELEADSLGMFIMA